MELNKFSEVSTSLVHDIEKNIIKKTYKKNTQIDLSINDLKELVDQYIYSLESSGISVPAIIDSYILDDELIYETEYCGKNIVELGLNTTNMKTYFSHIDAMMGIIKLAIKSDIFFDPHPKNFVFNGSHISYVDFFPPYSDYLIKKRMSIASTKQEAQIISENFNFFKKEYLIQHFCGDFLNIHKDLIVVFNSIYKKSVEMELFSGSFDDFSTKAKYIRNIEDVRLSKNLFLI